MPRVYLPLLPLPLLAVLVAASACSKPRSEEVSHVIPPPSFAALAPAATGAPPAPPAAAPAPEAAPQDEAPSAEEVKAFERPVRK
jgi:hypothetical protein